MANLGYVEYHIKVIKNIYVKTFRCTKCRYLTKSINFIENHVKRHNVSLQPFNCEKISIQPYSCVQYDLDTSHFDGSKLHLQNTSVKEKIYMCKYCNFETISLMLFFFHKRNCSVKNSNTTWFQCDKCNHRTKRKANVQTHVILKHTGPDEAQWFCCDYKSQLTESFHKRYSNHYHGNGGICNYQAKHNRVLKNHTSSDELQYFSCDKCDYKSVTRESLRTHVNKKHKNVCSFHCEFCDYNSQHKHCLKRHMVAKHTNFYDAEYLHCRKCDYKCLTKNTLKRHNMYKHADVMQYFNCDKCDYKTVRKDYLLLHIIRTHEIVYLYCELCNYKTKSNYLLNNHKIKKHPQTIDVQNFHCDK